MNPNILPSVELPAPSCADDRDQVPPCVMQGIRPPAEPPPVPLAAPTTPLINAIKPSLDHTSATPPEDAHLPTNHPVLPASYDVAPDDNSLSSSASDIRDILGEDFDLAAPLQWADAAFSTRGSMYSNSSTICTVKLSDPLFYNPLGPIMDPTCPPSPTDIWCDL